MLRICRSELDCAPLWARNMTKCICRALDEAVYRESVRCRNLAGRYYQVGFIRKGEHKYAIAEQLVLLVLRAKQSGPS